MKQIYLTLTMFWCIGLLAKAGGDPNAGSQFTETFTHSPNLIQHPAVDYNAIAEININGNIYVIENSGNGDFTHRQAGGFEGSASLYYSPHNVSMVTIRRKDHSKFIFYGLWMKFYAEQWNHNPFFEFHPLLTVSYNGDHHHQESFWNSGQYVLQKDIEVTSVTLDFPHLMDLFLDNLILGPSSPVIEKPTLSSTTFKFLGNSLKLSSSIINDGGADIQERGFVYATSHNPNIQNSSKIVAGQGSADFSADLTILTPGTTYYIKSYGINSADVNYGSEIQVTVPYAPSITSTPALRIPYDKEYAYSVSTNDTGLDDTEISATKIPDWLTLSNEGQNQASKFGDIPNNVFLRGVAGDAMGNIYAITSNGTSIYKISSDGSTSLWRSNLISGSIYSLHIAGNYIYIPRHSNSNNSITRIPLDNPAAGEETFASFQGGALYVSDYGDYVYASNHSSRQIVKIHKVTKEKTPLVFNNSETLSVNPYGISFDSKGNLYIASYGPTIQKFDGYSLSPAVSNLPGSATSIIEDDFGNFYISFGNNGVRKYSADFSSFEVVSLGQNDIVWDLAFTGTGALVYSLYNSNQVYKLQTGAMLSGLPTKANLGEHEVTLKVSNDFGYSEQNFTITVVDENRPKVVSKYPNANAYNVDLRPTLTLEFDEEIKLGQSGNFTFFKGESIVAEFSLEDELQKQRIQLSSDKKSIEFELEENLPIASELTAKISVGFVEDLHGNAFEGNYSWNFKTINKFEQSISFPAIEPMTFGDGEVRLGPEQSEAGLPITYHSNDADQVSISGNKAFIYGAGTFKITAMQHGNELYLPAEPKTQDLTVLPRTLLVSPKQDQTKIYGQKDNELAFSATGFAYKDDNNVFEGYLGRAKGEDVGQYMIDLGDLYGGKNYNIQLAEQVYFAIEAKELQVSAIAHQEKTYGDKDPKFIYQVSGFEFEDDEHILAGFLSREIGQNVGVYPISIGSLDAGKNYEITFTGNDFSIKPREITVTAQQAGKTYGESDPVLPFTLENLAYGEDETILQGSIQRSAGEGSGVYKYSLGSLSAGINYKISFDTEGSFEIKPKYLKIVADREISKIYGAQDPTLTFVASGFEYNDDIEILTGVLSRENGENIGDYKILQGSLSAGDNYVIDFMSSEDFRIYRKTLYVKPTQGQSKVYGSEEPILTYEASGFSFNETPSIIGGNLVRIRGNDVGEYTIYVGSLSAGSNYLIEFEGGIFTIVPKILQVQALPDQKKIYGENDPEFQIGINGLAFNDTEILVTGTAIREEGENAGLYLIKKGDISAGNNYEVDFHESVFTIEKAGLQLIAEHKSKVYGQENPELTFIYEGLVNGDTHIEAIPVISTDANSGSNVGLYDIKLAQAKDQNYEITLKDAKLEITQALLTIKAEDKSKVYGQENPELTFMYEGLVNDDTHTEVIPVISTDAKTSSNVGIYDIKLAQAKDQNYEIILRDAKMEITQAPLTIKAEDKSKVYGQKNPELTFEYEGLVNGDSHIETIPVISTDAKAGSNVGFYDIKLAQAKDQNYEITLKDAKLEITPAQLTIKAEDKSKVYGQENPELTFMYEGLVNDDTHTEVIPVISTDAKTSSNVGIYDIKLAQAKDQNYEIILRDAKMEITQAPLTIKAEDQSKVYGQENPELTFIYEGLVNGDTHIEAIPAISTDANSGSNVGLYDIKLAQAKDQNYEITLKDAKLKITQALLTIKADDKSKVYGQENPELTFVYEGLVNGDEKPNTEPSIATGAEKTSSTGLYPVSVKGAEDKNYLISYSDGQLVITPAKLQVVAHTKSKIYGDENPELTFEYQGLVNGDKSPSTPANIHTAVDYRSAVGSYNIVVDKAADKNYEISYKNSTFEVKPAMLTVTAAADQEKIYGVEDPVFEYTVTGLKAGDDESVMSGRLTRIKGENPGKYAIQLGNMSANNNYLVDFIAADFSILGVLVEKIMDPADVSAAWGQYPDMPKQVVIMSQDGRFLELNINWDFDQANIYARGTYPVKGYLENTTGIINVNNLSSEINFTVLPKAAPQDITMNNQTFKGSASEFFLHVGAVSVMDPVDEYHVLELVENAYDNQYFEIHDKGLFWSSAERLSGRTAFDIQVRVTDRDGNILDKVFRIERERLPANDITIHTSFTPDGDGINDDWGINDLRFYDGVSVSVFERSGKRVFYTENPDTRWDGSFNNTNLAAGTYYYVVEIRELKLTRKGFVTILKK